MNIEPLHNYVAIKPNRDAAQTTAGGLVVKSEAAPASGEVMAVGPGKVTDAGIRLTPTVQVGDVVTFPSYMTSSSLYLDGEELALIRESELIAKVNPPIGQPNEN